MYSFKIVTNSQTTEESLHLFSSVWRKRVHSPTGAKPSYVAKNVYDVVMVRKHMFMSWKICLRRLNLVYVVFTDVPLHNLVKLHKLIRKHFAYDVTTLGAYLLHKEIFPQNELLIQYFKTLFFVCGAFTNPKNVDFNKNLYTI